MTEKKERKQEMEAKDAEGVEYYIICFHLYSFVLPSPYSAFSD